MQLKNRKEMFLALVMALTLWYGVSGSEKFESQVEVRVEYRGLPQGLTVSGGYVGKVAVRLRASAGVLRSVSDRDFSVQMDLSGVREGENVLAVHPAYRPIRGGVEVIDVSPSRIILNVDKLTKRTVPLEAQLQGAVPRDMQVAVSFVPPLVAISGAASVLGDIEKITIPVRVESSLVPGTSESKRALPLPDGVDAEPGEVTVVMQAGEKRRQIAVGRTVLFDAAAAGGRVARPDRVRITIRLPESSAPGAAADRSIRAYVDPERESVESVLPVQVDLPDGVELVSVDPSRVSLVKENAPDGQQTRQPAARTPAQRKAPAAGGAAPQPAKPAPQTKTKTKK
ncbi:MAG: hypothetical protein LBQ51_01800 [Desulfovibrio sp.]|nr:hypothetical protein [Desulfovibrio sp.]